MTDCQRWDRGRHAWRHTSEGGFDRSRFEVAELRDDTTPRRFVVSHHYAHSYPAVIRRYGLYEGWQLVGVAVLGAPARAAVLTNVFPHLAPYVESLELSRFVLLDRVPANAESWFWARCRELLARAGVAGVVTFSDPIARTTLDGRVLMPGHVGTIYQASNGRPLGRGSAATLLVLPDATVLNGRSAQKVRGDEVGHEAVERVLVSHGATPRRAGEPGAAWLAHALTEARVRRLRHPGCHRYAWSIGPRRKYVQIGMPEQRPYPKQGVA